jgi:hypothetical protein
MGNIPISFDYGRRAEYLTSALLSPYAITVPIRGHDDRLQSDFVCVGLEEDEAAKCLVPNLGLLFWLQTKSQSVETPCEIEISSPSIVRSILANQMPYFVAIVYPQMAPPELRLYETSERIAFRHLFPNIMPKTIHFVPGTPPPGSKRPYAYNSSDGLASIFMGEPFLIFRGTESLKRDFETWEALKGKIEVAYLNFIFATTGIRHFLRSSEARNEVKVFYNENGELEPRGLMFIHAALEMLNMSLIRKERKADPMNPVVKAMDTLIAFMERPDHLKAEPSPEAPGPSEGELLISGPEV